MSNDKLSNEVMYIILSCLKKRTQNEDSIVKDIESKLNTSTVLGMLIKHRLTGYYNNFSIDSLYTSSKEVQKVITTLLSDYESNHKHVETEADSISEKFKESGVKYAYLKGVFYKVGTYDKPLSKSNDTDILVSESDLDKVDHCLRELGYWQSFGEKVNFAEASKREKVIQILNHHDLVPYIKKRNDGTVSEIDINIHFDRNSNQITDAILESHRTEINNKSYLTPNLAFLHLCVHFDREFHGQIWIDRKSDLTLYKVVDLLNVYRNYQIDMKEIIELANKYNVYPAVETTVRCVDGLVPKCSFFKDNKEQATNDLTSVNEELIERLVGV